MSDLQTAYYIVGLIFMGSILLIMLVIVASVLVIRAKINAIHKHIERRLGQVTDWAEKSNAVASAIKKAMSKNKE